MNKPKLIISSACAAILTVVFVVVVTIWAELSAPLKDWLKNFSGHHWTSKSIFSALLYAAATAALYQGFRNPSGDILRKALVFVLISTALGTVILAAFYAGHHFSLFKY
ncbi:MAG: hypothetical protein A3I22_00405 [Parcubacteria group bacterium RIFCSPLOWO2_02_FULL_40_12]|nr:MAG: hypothetical protein A3I22_00405 [Parcubacteria group bacterium RIFCSPLOWO2_02_FULL_40_12]